MLAHVARHRAGRSADGSDADVPVVRRDMAKAPMRVHLWDGLMHLEIGRDQYGSTHRVACLGRISLQNKARHLYTNNTTLTCLRCMAWWLRNVRSLP